MNGEWFTWDDAFMVGAGMALGVLVGLALPTWVVALSPVWVIVIWLVLQIVRSRRQL